MAVNDNKVENKVETVEKAEEKKPELPNTKEGRLVKELLEKAPYAEGSVRREKRIEFKVPAERIHEFLELASERFEMLMQISVVDWLKENQFELVYQLWSVSESVHAFVRTRVPRENAEVPTAMDIWPVAETYEREAHEFFGINFKGNPRLGPFILEPREYEKHPLRKDFNTLSYVKTIYGDDFDRYDESKTNYVI
ncbi:NADH-quinone oxidoreductase subunit C [Thermococcus nautili]|uniref:NADH:ubiquinone oxidoreductase 27 kD subunit n=1 Tax=Thermococcus nautili TaxID=195522 RepID=W8NZW2_9EURY|nr:NADH-quinone oxidoreductase subunit C [Thermococcus nautili]AHL22016.1 NADH:ubiquinone oxidoreductase 27 kD subunit [Thermococcus nautili]CAI1493939.1 NADH-ubiquinone oxidoreductase chain C [Thermococcus nautili]